MAYVNYFSVYTGVYIYTGKFPLPLGEREMTAEVIWWRKNREMEENSNETGKENEGKMERKRLYKKEKWVREE
jgi:hypothetical protein